MKKFGLFCLLVFTSLFSFAQHKCFFTHYSSEDGLSQNTVMNILQDHKGNMWFATWDGINKFNGYSFKTYKARQGNLISLTNNRVDRMYEDRYGYLWVLTYDNRAHRFDPRTETFEQVPATGEASTYNVLTIEVLPNGVVWLLTESDGAIRVRTDADTYRLSTDTYSVKSGLFPATRVYKAELDQSGNEWILTDNGLGLIKKGEKKMTPYFVDAKDGREHADQAFYGFAESQNELFCIRQGACVALQ